MELRICRGRLPAAGRSEPNRIHPRRTALGAAGDQPPDRSLRLPLRTNRIPHQALSFHRVEVYLRSQRQIRRVQPPHARKAACRAKQAFLNVGHFLQC